MKLRRLLFGLTVVVGGFGVWLMFRFLGYLEVNAYLEPINVSAMLRSGLGMAACFSLALLCWGAYKARSDWHDKQKRVYRLRHERLCHEFARETRFFDIGESLERVDLLTRFGEDLENVELELAQITQDG